MTTKEESVRGLRELMKSVCKSYGRNEFTSYEVYSRMLDLPKKNGSRRHYSLTYAEVKQNMARAEYLERVNTEDKKNRTTKYKNRNIIEGLL